jgi:hypothetical protein
MIPCKIDVGWDGTRGERREMVWKGLQQPKLFMIK